MTCQWQMNKWAWGTGGMIMTRGNWITLIKTCHSDTLFTTDHTRSGLGFQLFCNLYVSGDIFSIWPPLFGAVSPVLSYSDPATHRFFTTASQKIHRCCNVAANEISLLSVRLTPSNIHVTVINKYVTYRCPYLSRKLHEAVYRGQIHWLQLADKLVSYRPVSTIC